MELWIPITIVAAFCQNLRSALQKRLKSSLSTWGATASRFVFASPLALILLAIVLSARELPTPSLTPNFLGYAIAGGLAQIVATGLLLHLFTYQNFTVATALTKTEPIQVALFGIVLLSEPVALAAFVAIIVSLAGVGFLSIPRDRLQGARWFDRKALTGIISGGLFGLSATAYRGASLSLSAGDTLLRATLTLAFVTTFQAIVVMVWLKIREPGELTRLFRAWRPAAAVGLVGMVGSLAWFTAFTLENAAHVRAVGQIEVVFMIAASVLMFKERIALREIIGVALVTLGILGLILLT